VGFGGDVPNQGDNLCGPQAKGTGNLLWSAAGRAQRAHPVHQLLAVHAGIVHGPGESCQSTHAASRKPEPPKSAGCSGAGMQRLQGERAARLGERNPPAAPVPASAAQAEHLQQP
jgi:hypothetical protein